MATHPFPTDLPTGNAALDLARANMAGFALDAYAATVRWDVTMINRDGPGPRAMADAYRAGREAA